MFIYITFHDLNSIIYKIIFQLITNSHNYGLLHFENSMNFIFISIPTFQMGLHYMPILIFTEAC